MKKPAATPAVLNSYQPPALEEFRLKENLLEEDVDLQMADYFKAIIKNNNLSSYSELADLLGFKRATITEMRYGRTFPTEENMMRIADLAGHDQRLALLDLRIWKSAADTRNHYKDIQKLIKRLGVTAAALAAFVFVNVPAAHAASEALHYVKDSVYYEKI